MFCGVTSYEAFTLGYSTIAGTGYGNFWYKHVASPTFSYSGLGSVILKYVYRVDSEPGYDIADVIVDVYDQVEAGPPADSDWVEAAVVAERTGASGLARDSLNITSTLSPYGAIKYRIRVGFYSDGGYSDEDGNYPSTCGAFGFDDVSVSGGGVAYFNDFETGTDWETVVPLDPSANIGDFARTTWIEGLSPAVSGDPCASVPGSCDLADSVIVLFDPTPVRQPHPSCQDNHFQSPPIPLDSHAGYRGFVLHFEYFAKIGTCVWGVGDSFHPFWGVRYRPRQNGQGWSDWTQNFYWTQDHTSNTGGLPSCGKTEIDVSSLIPASAESVQIRLGGFNEDCGGWDYCEVNDNTPYFDNVSFGIYGNDSSPIVTMDETWRWQDQFPKDGTLSPTSTVDTRTGLQPNTSNPSIFGDTLVCHSGSSNTEVSLVFKIPRVGPGIQKSHAFFTSWFPGVLDGEGNPTDAWQVARMDTAEAIVGGVPPVGPVSGYWMAAFHEADAIRADNGLSEGGEILPNGLFTPGTRVEYFLKAKFAGGGSEFLLPDTSGGNYLEFEVLPMMESVAGQLRWPCVLLASHSLAMTDDGRYGTELVKDALRANGFVFDEYNRLAPAFCPYNYGSGIGRASSTGQFQGPGATAIQLSAYNAILVSGGSKRNTVGQYDVNVLDGWLAASDSLHPRFLWISGDEALRTLTPTWGTTFLKNRLCASYVNNYYSQYTGDVTYCLPLDGWSGGRIQCAPLGGPENERFVVVANRCTRQFDVAGLSGVQGCSGVRELAYNKTRNGETYAVSISAAGSPNYRSLIEGYDLTAIRSNASLGPPACSVDTASARARALWVQCVLGNFGGVEHGSYCYVTTVSVDKPSGGTPPAAFVTRLEQSYPNPTNPTATIRFSVGKPGRVTLRVYNIAGRLIRTLFDEKVVSPGKFSLIWDGKNDDGEKVSSGVFFYQLEASGFKSAKKIVIVQ
jgi:hypothetical protein